MKKGYGFVILLTATPPAYAYLDPGTGSMLFSAVLGVIATLYFLMKNVFYKAAGFLFGLFGVKVRQKSKYGLVFYSEGQAYWNTFKHVIEVLDKKGMKVTYLTSGEDDEGLKYESENIEAKYIGKGNAAYAMLNMLEADLCVLTTPGLDVLQIRRSKGVKHYTHLVHSLADAGLYKLYSFDYFDSVMCSGKHQMHSIRCLEEKRGTREKELLETGCTYMDVLEGKLSQGHPERKINEKNTAKTRVLVAPTWGKNGLLSIFGLSLLKPLAQAGYEVIVRPHPQSFISESELMNELQQALQDCSNVSWDRAADGFESLVNSDVLISDLSSIIFDYSFVLEKPVVTMAFELELAGTEANDLPHNVWEVTVLDKIGKQIAIDEIDRLPNIIGQLASNPEFGKEIRELRDESLFNYRKSAEVAAGQLAGLLQKVRA